LTRARDQIAGEALEVIDQPRLEAHHGGDLGTLELDGACETRHEGLRVVR
jgi:hypothetical protein